MAITVTATLVGVTYPRQVQVEVLGLTVSDVVTITGAAGSDSWTVRGASEVVATGAQLIRRDQVPPVNVDVTYTARVNGVDYSATAVEVPFSADYLVSSLDGAAIAPLTWLDNRDPVEYAMSQHLTRVPGRTQAVVRYSRAGSESGAWQFMTETLAATSILKAMIQAGAPVVVRTNAALVDFPAVRTVVFTGASSQLLGMGADNQRRRWSMPWAEVADPLASVSASGATLADFSTVITAAGGTIGDWNDYVDALGGTIADINRHDWETAAS